MSRISEQTSAGAGPPDERIAKIASWLVQFSRVLKSARLYDARSPITIKFRSELGTAMEALLEEHGVFRLDFSAHQIHCDGHPVLVPRPGESDFAMPFYRDGLRTLTFNDDAEAWELDLIVDFLLLVTSRNDHGGEDLITLL